MSSRVRLTLKGLALLTVLGTVAGLFLGPGVLCLKIPYLINGIGLLNGTAVLLIAAGLLLSPCYAEDWIAVLQKVESLPRAVTERFVWGLAGIVFGIIAALKACQYNSFQAHTDLAIFTNVCWQTLHGHILKDGVKGLDSYLGDHFSPILVLFAPLLAVWKSPLILQFAQSFLLALSIPGIYRLARSYTTSPTLALMFPLALAVNPFFHRTASAYFEPSTLAVPILIWAFVAWRTGHLRWAGFLVFLTLTLKEEAPFALLGLGLYLTTRPGRKRRYGFVLIISSIVCFLAITQWIIPYYLPMDVKSRHLDLFSGLGDTYSDIALNILGHPLNFAINLFWPPAKWTAPLWLLFSVGLLPLGAPMTLIPLAVMILPHQMTGYNFFGYQALSVHYAALPLALILGSAGAGLGRLENRLRQDLKLTLAMFCFVVGTGLITPSPYVEGLPLSRQRIEAAHHILGLVPEQASVWAPPYFVAHLACRDRLKSLTDREYLYRNWFAPDCLILDRRAWPALPEGTKKDILLLFKKARYRQAAEDQGVVLLQKI